MARKEALAELIAKVEAGAKYETMGHTQMCQRAFPKPSDFDGSREAYSNSAAQMAILAWRNDDLNAAKSLHEKTLLGWGYEICCGGEVTLRQHHNEIFIKSETPARAWLLAILRALHGMETP